MHHPRNRDVLITGSCMLMNPNFSRQSLGCHGKGPASLSVRHIHFTQVIARSWSQSSVRSPRSGNYLRHVDMPMWAFDSKGGLSMPLVRIEVRRPWAPQQKKAIIEAVHSAMREALAIPENDRQIRYVEYRAEDFEVPPGKTENYTLVEITMFAGRSLSAKKALYQALVRKLGTLGIAGMDLLIVLVEVPLENWGIRGGVPASEVDLGFKVEV